MKKGIPPSQLIHHEFFDILKYIPCDIDSSLTEKPKNELDSITDAMNELSLKPKPIIKSSTKSTSSRKTLKSKPTTKKSKMSATTNDENQSNFVGKGSKKLNWDAIKCVPKQEEKKPYSLRSSTSWQSSRK